MLKLYYVRKSSKEHKNKKELIAFGEYDTLQGLYNDLYSNHSHCLVGTYLIVNDARVWQVRVNYKYCYGSEKEGITDWEISDTYMPA